MSYTYVGATPRFLSTGRPVTFGTVLEEGDLLLADDATKASLVPPVVAPVTPAEPIPAPTEAPAPAEAPAAPAPADTPAAPAQEVVANPGNPS